MNDESLYILHDAPSGEVIRFEPSTGKAWVVRRFERGNEIIFYWQPIQEGDPMKPAEQPKELER